MIRNPVFLERLGELSVKSDLVWLAALSVGLGFTLIAAFLFPFSASGVFWAYAGLLIRVGLFLWSGRSLAGQGGATLIGLFGLGMVAGVFEILVDWALIHWICSAS